MKNCREIEELLPFYEEGELSDADRRAVFEHLASCAACQKELAYLKKARALTGQMPQFNEPPWFQQKIMAEVRKEAAKKSFSQKWFYPLRIKIPVQIMATIVIAVLAVYIYRSGNETVRQVLPGTQLPSIETRNEPALVKPKMQPSPSMAAPAAPDQAASLKQDAGREEEPPRKKDSDDGVYMPARMQDKARPAPEVNASAAQKPAAAKDKMAASVGGSPDSAQAEKTQRAASVQADAQVAQKQEAGFEDKERHAQDQLQQQSVKEKKAVMNAPSAPRTFMASSAASVQASVHVGVENPAAAALEVEKILTRSEGKITSRQIRDKRVILRAHLSGAKWKDVLLKLQNIGPIQEKIISTHTGPENILAEIEISKKDDHELENR